MSVEDGNAPRYDARTAGRPGERLPAVTGAAHCELCAAVVDGEHRHIVDLEARGLLCACRACSLLFTAAGAGGSRYRTVPDRYLSFPELALSRAQWDALQIPVSVAFFFVNSSLGRVAAFYPGPAGATESLLPLDAWERLVADHPGLATLVPDVEALLVRADPGGGAVECLLVPIDACYELVGELRLRWRGFDGGAGAAAALDGFFARARERAVPARP